MHRIRTQTAFPTYIVHHHYDAAKDDELTLRVGELIKVSEQSDPGWWVGEDKGGKSGWFPSNVRQLSFQSPVFNEACHVILTGADTEPTLFFWLVRRTL